MRLLRILLMAVLAVFAAVTGMVAAAVMAVVAVVFLLVRAFRRPRPSPRSRPPEGTIDVVATEVPPDSLPR